MKWSELIVQVRDRLQEESGSFFSDERLMDIARRVQAEVATVTECLEVMESVNVSAGAVEVELPEDCLNVLAASSDDYALAMVDFRRVRPKVYPSGRPCCFYVYGNSAGLYPAPADDAVLKLWYSQRPALGALRVSHGGAGGATDASVEVKGGVMSLVVTGGSYAGTSSLTLGTSPCATVGELVAEINGLGKGWTATRVSGCRSGEDATGLELGAVSSAFNKEVVLDLGLKLPEQFQPLVELGTVYRALWKDTEYEAGEVYKKEYLERLDGMRRVFLRRRSRSGVGAVADVYGAAGRCGARGVFIP